MSVSAALVELLESVKAARLWTVLEPAYSRAQAALVAAARWRHVCPDVHALDAVYQRGVEDGQALERERWVRELRMLERLGR